MVIVKTKKWGNSIGVVIPADVVTQMGLKAGQEISIDVKKSDNVLKGMFGAGKFSKDTETLLKETRKEMQGR
jgi:antitoxin component of MazEF toxin-antitoxin module